jgi:hypothetical protein
MTSTTENHAPIEYFFNGVLVDPATVFGAPKHGRELYAVQSDVAFAYAVREALSRSPEVINLHG